VQQNTKTQTLTISDLGPQLARHLWNTVKTLR